MMMCPKPHCPEESKSGNKMCAKKTDSCCGYECAEIKPPVKPCIMIDCAPGYDIMMTDERGCGGMCVAVCKRVKDMEECARMPECKVDKNAYEDPETFEVSDVCIESAGPVCCAAMTAGCLACSQGYKSAAAGCTDNPDKLNCADVKMPDTCKSCVASGLKWSAGSASGMRNGCSVLDDSQAARLTIARRFSRRPGYARRSDCWRIDWHHGVCCLSTVYVPQARSSVLA